MTTLLRIDASTRMEGSHSRRLADYYQTQWEKTHPEGKLVFRDLACDPVPHLTNETIEAFQSEGASSAPNAALSHLLIEELRAADHVLISSPLYNLSLPSTLKAYFDYVVRAGLTFDFEHNQFTGRLHGTTGTIITTRGGLIRDPQKEDFQTPYLEEILSFMGISPVKTILLQGTMLEAEARQKYFEQALHAIDCLFLTQKGPLWEGRFSEKERQEINDLRDSQARAITNGDAVTYTGL